MKGMNKAAILDFIRSLSRPATKREIAHAFHIKGGVPRIELKKILKELEKNGDVEKNPGGAYGIPEGLPAVAVLEVTDITPDGDILAAPVERPGQNGKGPHIEIVPGHKTHGSLIVGSRVMARLSRIGPESYEARVIRSLDQAAQGSVTGLVRITRGGAILIPADKKTKHEFEIEAKDLGGAVDGDVAAGTILPGRGLHNRRIRIVKILGRHNDPKAISLISLYEAGLAVEFPKDVLKEAERFQNPSPFPRHARAPSLSLHGEGAGTIAEAGEGREDLRAIPLVTIDGPDARDFDDAVFAEKSGDGFHLIVAIADVAHYVRSGTPLDREAARRGNSTYFPDRVVPMLPEALSNDLCSLRPHEDRACLAVHMWIDAAGALTQYKFARGLMRSAARLTYEQAQAAKDGISDNVTKKLYNAVIAPLYDAFAVLDKARIKRGALELDLPERQILLDDQGRMTGVRRRARLDSHKLIEEFMILANVAAAKALGARKACCVYRVHDRPASDKLEGLSDFVESFGLSLPRGQVTNPAQINQLLRKAAPLPYSHLISQMVMRCQSQARYSPHNIGHFGLALYEYAHFTSPIRRYADLLVHRSLIAACGLGSGGLTLEEAERIESLSDHISQTERVSMEAERSATDRFTAAYLSGRIGAEFEGRITGVTRFGLFVELSESGADGLVPIRSLLSDYYDHDEPGHALIGRRSGRVFRLGAPVTARLVEASGLTGSTLLELVGHEKGADIPGVPFKKPQFQRKSRPSRPSNRSKGPKKPGRHGKRKPRR